MRKVLFMVVMALALSGCSLFDHITLPEGCAAFKITEISLLSSNGLLDVTDYACGQNWGYVLGEIMKKHPSLVAITDAKTCEKKTCREVADNLKD